MAGTRVFEAFLGAALLLTTLAISYSFLPRAQDQAEIRDFGDGILSALSFDQNFRTMVAGTDSNAKAGLLRETISAYFTNPFFLQVCDSDNTCYGSLPDTFNYVTSSYFYEGNSTNYSPKTVYLYMKVLE